MKEASGPLESEPVSTNGINHVISSEEFANLAMEGDIGMNFLTNNFDASTDLSDSHALNDEIWFSNNDFGNLVPDISNFSNRYSSSFAIPGILNVFDDLNPNTTVLPLSGPGGSNNERVVALDNSEIQSMSSINYGSLATTINFDISFQEPFDSEFDINIAALSLSNPRTANFNSEPRCTLDNANIVALSYPNMSILDFDRPLQVGFNTEIEPNHQQSPSHPEGFEDLQDTSPTQTVPKPYLPQIG